MLTRTLAAVCLIASLAQAAPAQEKATRHHYLYVVVPGIRNQLEFGGKGIVVFDIERDHAFVKRLATTASDQAKPENIKGVAASAVTDRLYFTTLTRLYAFDLKTEKTLWDKALPDGCDRLAITPDGKTLYVPTLERDHWNVVDAATGDLVTRLETKNGAHNTVVGSDGTRMYLAGLRSPLLSVADTKDHKLVKKVGPFTAAIRPFTVDAAQERCYVCVNGLLGFEIGDIKTGEKLARVEVQGVKQGPPKRHGCPSHGVGLTPDEKEVWVCDGFNGSLHVFDNTVMPPKQVSTIKLREQPGWVTFSGDGRYGYPSTGEVVDTKTKSVLLGLRDEEGREVHSEKIVELIFDGDDVIWAGNQFGVGRKGMPAPPSGR